MTASAAKARPRPVAKPALDSWEAATTVAAVTPRRCYAASGLRKGTRAMLHIALWEPEIPPNTGNVARLCAATDTNLHLVGRLGLHLSHRALRRAWLGYRPAVPLERAPPPEHY